MTNLLHRHDIKFFVPKFIALHIFKLESMLGPAHWIEADIQPSSVFEETLLTQMQVFSKKIGLTINFGLHQVRRSDFTSAIREVLLLLDLNRHYMCLKWIPARNWQLSLLREGYGRDCEQQNQR